MFAGRCIIVLLAVFGLLYVPLSIVVGCGWRSALRACRHRSPQFSANVLFGLRILPLVIAALITLAVALPSFLLLEPRSAEEPFGLALLALGAVSLGFLLVGIFRFASAQAQTSQALSNWLAGAAIMESRNSVKVFRTGRHTPAATAAGVCVPKVLVSETAVAMLSAPELQAALRHEISHVRSGDNLKKVLFRFSAFPGMIALERSWSRLAEMAADDNAVSSFRDALDLAAALIKLSRLAPIQPSAEFTTSLLHSTTALSARVERLFAWEGRQVSGNHSGQWWYAVPPVLATCVVVAMSYGAMLAQMHEVTEWLVQ